MQPTTKACAEVNAGSITIRRLRDNELQCGQILKLLVEGYSVAEISQVVGRGERSIYRLLKRIEREFSTSVNS